MKIHVEIDLEDHPTRIGSRLAYDYAIDRLHEDELRVPAEPPFAADHWELMRWQERRAKARQVAEQIADCISGALTSALETSHGR